jgi:hypothetical protein
MMVLNEEAQFWEKAFLAALTGILADSNTVIADSMDMAAQCADMALERYLLHLKGEKCSPKRSSSSG